jgi:hypothetical protein
MGYKHGHTVGRRFTSEYGIWSSMKDRCRNPNNKEFKNYGARGIQVCERWMTFANFLADIGHKPSPKHSIERINNDKGYEPGNCKWATMSDQVRNRRVTKLSPMAARVIRRLRGTDLTRKQIADLFSVCVSTVKQIWSGQRWSLDAGAVTPIAVVLAPTVNAAQRHPRHDQAGQNGEAGHFRPARPQ